MFIRVLAVASLSALFLVACNPAAEEPTPEEDVNQEDVMEDKMEDKMEDDEMMEDIGFQNRIVMTAVEGATGEGEGLYGVNGGETRVYATFNTEDPEEGYFYEGWLVCDGVPYTTNALEKFDGLWENVFASTDVPESCQRYVLTIEPDDGDPAPAGHVFEGAFEGIAHTEEVLEWDAEMFNR